MLGGALAIDGLLVRAARVQHLLETTVQASRGKDSSVFVDRIALGTKQSHCALHIMMLLATFRSGRSSHCWCSLYDLRGFQ